MTDLEYYALYSINNLSIGVEHIYSPTPYDCNHEDLSSTHITLCHSFKLFNISIICTFYASYLESMYQYVYYAPKIAGNLIHMP